MENKKIIFVILVYGNFGDLLKFKNSIPYSENEYQIVVVSSFKSQKNNVKGKKICNQINAIFLDVPNNGYGYGNNIGIDYSLKNFKFDYLILSNPDVEIKSISLSDIKKECIMGPKIINDGGKNQNPHYFKKEVLGFKILKEYVKSKKAFWLYMYLFVNKISKKICKLKNRNKKIVSVYALHGSFFAMSFNTVVKLTPLFNDRMFLYAEENHVAELAKKNNVKMLYNTGWLIRHHENGSGNTNNAKVRLETLNSLTEFFHNWR